MNKITTLQKLIGFAVILAIFPIAIGAYALSGMHKISIGINEMYNVHMKGLEESQGLNINALRSIVTEKNVIIADSAQDKMASLVEIENDNKIIDGYLESLPKYFVTPRGKQLLEKMTSAARDWRLVRQQVIEFAKLDEDNKAQQLSSTTAREKARIFFAAIKEVVDFKASLAAKLSETSNQMYDANRLVTICGVVLSVIIGLALGLIMARTMMRQLGDEPASLSELALEIAGGNLGSSGFSVGS